MVAHAAPDKQIALALQQALAFPLARASTLRFPAERAAEAAQQEAGFGSIPVDENGMSAGMKLHLLQPIRAVLSDWRQARAAFDTALQPKMADILATREAERDLAEAEQARREALEGVENRLKADSRHQKALEQKDNAYGRWKSFNDIHAGRAPTLFAYNPLYKLLILCIGVAEWFINYDTLLEFSGVPAIAAGSTAILGALLAFAAHGHGELLKQWSFRFNESRQPRERARDWRYLGLSSVALLIVLAAAGTARYSAALQILESTVHQSSGLNLNVGTLDVNPLRDVLISLLANVAAWVVGIFISYAAHDDDPDYMAATRQWNGAHAAWRGAGARMERERRHIEARFTRTIADRRTAAKSRAASVVGELNMIRQVDSHEAALSTELEQVLLSNIETYRDAVTRAALNSGGRVQLVAKGTGMPISPFEFKVMALPEPSALQLLLAA